MESTMATTMMFATLSARTLDDGIEFLTRRWVAPLAATTPRAAGGKDSFPLFVRLHRQSFLCCHSVKLRVGSACCWPSCAPQIPIKISKVKCTHNYCNTNSSYHYSPSKSSHDGHWRYRQRHCETIRLVFGHEMPSCQPELVEDVL